MTNDEKSQTMDSNLGEPNEDDEQDTETLHETPSAPNFIENGMCNACGHDVDTLQYSIQCFNCKTLYHAVGCVDSSYCVSAKTSFTQHFRPALEKSGSYENRFGKFFLCAMAAAQSLKQNKLFHKTNGLTYLIRKWTISGMNFLNELSEIKKLIISIST